MRFAALVALSLAVASGALAAPAAAPPSGDRTIPGPAVVPAAYQQMGLSSSSTPFEFTINLHGQNMDALEARMTQIATSGGQWLSDDELASYASPDAVTLAAVKTFLTLAGVPESAISYSKFNDAITVQSTVGQVSKLFGGAQFYDFNVNGQTVSRTKQFTIPAVVANFVQDVSPLNSFSNVKANPPVVKQVPEAQLASRAAPSSCNTAQVTPACLRDLYGTTSYTPSPVSGQTDVGVLGFIGQYVSQSDLTTFLKRYRPDAASYQIPIKNAGGGTNDPTMPGIEAMLDVETVIAQNYPLKTEFLYYGAQTGDIFQQGLAYYLNNYSNTTRPGVISVSYGDIEQDFTASQASTLCSTAQKLTASGTTVVFASGDNGVDSVQASSAPSCSNGFVPTYPSGCPYILSVGGLQNFSPEVAVDTTLAGFWGGSGFSTLFSVPSYQTSAQKAYVSKLGSTASGYYNKNGRAFPDVSAQASNYVIASGGSFYTVGGTSAAAPTISSILSLINDARRKAGKARIGWVQPTIYANTAGLTDITSGKALGCPSPQQNIGLLVESGYDAVTGLGSPQFANLRTVFGA